MFAALVEYEKGHGHCNVPHRWAENLKLGGWVNKQKIAKKNGKLSAERIRRLDGIEFVWDQLEAAWEEMFAALVKYKNVHGDCKVPQAWAEDRKLGRWIVNQRVRKKNGELGEERIQRLDDHEFVWDSLEAAWEEKFASLVEYKKVHGHSNVRLYWKENPALGKWLSHQRNFMRKGQLSKERIQRFNAIGFKWRLSDKH